MGPRVIKASEVREYVFCPRSWAYRQRKIASTPEAAAEREERLDQGNRSHREHGEAVCRVSRQLGVGALSVKIGLAVLILGVLAWKFFSS
jgi:CRISPR/Cas system-associated exonuclease Cas4 (RecB family)